MIKITIALCLVLGTNCQNTDSEVVKRFDDIFGEHKGECLGTSKDISGLFQGSSNVQAPKSEDFKCYFKCIFEKIKLIDENFELDSNVLKKFLPGVSDSVTNAIIEKCKTVSGESNCDKAYGILKCVFDNFKDKFSMGIES
ncbi:hypothetical protein FQR65_LT07123 [Abscondita terminalis]|nr:hypothetical protein FQR65_LT07123 [Abscondita terminalis]